MRRSNKSLRFGWLFLFVAAILMTSLSVTDSLAKEAKALVDLNSASQQDLEGLKGVGAATAKKIIENRPYKSVDELSKAGLSAKKIEALKPFVTAGPASASQPAKKETPAKAPASPEKTAAKTAPSKAPSGTVDLNTADQKTLESLPGVGPKTAEEIIKGRPYKTVDELSKVKGMSKGKVDALKGMVTVGAPKGPQPSAPSGAPAAPAPTVPAKAAPAPKAPAAGVEKQAAPMKLAPGQKVNINTASKEQLEALPGIGPAKAQAIIDGRPYSAPEDIMKVKGIKEGTFNKVKDLITVK